APTVYSSAVSSFRGLDLGRTAANVDMSRSPDAVNMIRDELGKVRKRMGWHTVESYAERINGAHVFDGHTFIHAGSKLYIGKTVVGDMKDGFSQGFVIDKKLWLLDGEKLRVLKKTDGAYILSAAEDEAYVPTVIISRDPGGAGVVYEDYNLIGRKFVNSFLGTASATVYQLTDDMLDADEVTVKVLDASGVWAEKKENTDFTVDRTTGTVTFTTAPGVSPVDGEDNVKITASKTHEGYAGRINGCTIGTLYGINGAADRLFVSGNPEFKNCDWHSELGDLSMFGDMSYALLGHDESAVTGYSVIAGYLAAHKSASQDGRNVIMRLGETDGAGKAVFPIVSALQGEGDIAPRAHAYLGAEPLFLTSRGVYAITSGDITGEKYSQSRSAFLDAAIVKERGLSDACACVWNDFYLLAVNSKIYALDLLQKTYLPDEPYSSYQYEGYVLDNVPARVLWQKDGVLRFGTDNGEIREFYTDKGDPLSYNDDGAAILAHWDTPYFTGRLRHHRKHFNYLSVSLAPHPVTSAAIYARKNGLWERLFDNATTARYFLFEYLHFNKLTFSTDRFPRCLGRKIDVRVVDKTQFRFENHEKNEPFGIYDFTLEYTETEKF
ncbi:MAG: hypothetical protein IKL92_04950, partial [Oscillospiraceae bacterium]|nr:hypothetical protein [Oscillospiraceae bacterium]